MAAPRGLEQSPDCHVLSSAAGKDASHELDRGYQCLWRGKSGKERKRDIQRERVCVYASMHAHACASPAQIQRTPSPGTERSVQQVPRSREVSSGTTEPREDGRGVTNCCDLEEGATLSFLPT